MPKIIITADDYGMCDAVDKAIDAGIENGVITTANVMLNMESLENARDLGILLRKYRRKADERLLPALDHLQHRRADVADHGL